MSFPDPPPLYAATGGDSSGRQQTTGPSGVCQILSFRRHTGNRFHNSRCPAIIGYAWPCHLLIIVNSMRISFKTVSRCLGLTVAVISSVHCSADRPSPDNEAGDAGQDGPPAAAPDAAAIVAGPAETDPWLDSGAAQIESTIDAFNTINNKRGAARNIILFVGDGMGVSTVTAARILDGQNRGGPGEDHQLSFERFPFTGFSKTYNVDVQTPDSAGTMTAMITGVKTNAGLISVSERTRRGDCDSSKSNELTSALELAALAGMSTGIVTTTRVTHATPAATYAKSADRGWEADSLMPARARRDGCEDIAAQLIGFPESMSRRFGVDGAGIDVVFGGGLQMFLPRTRQPGAAPGLRTDGRNLVDEWQTLHPDGKFITGADQLAQLDTGSTSKVLGLFNASHMRFHAEQQENDTGEPSLSFMTEKAIELLKKNSHGFFLMIEGGRIDHAHHGNNAFNALWDTVALADAVATARTMTRVEDTLIIVTADHSHVLTMAGYPPRGNPILGKVTGLDNKAVLAADGQPYTTLSYANGPAFRNPPPNADPDGHHPVRNLTEAVDTTAARYHQEALVPLDSETHGGEDVGIYASGPGAHLISGVIEQHVIFHAMEHAGDLKGQTRKSHADASKGQKPEI